MRALFIRNIHEAPAGRPLLSVEPVLGFVVKRLATGDHPWPVVIFRGRLMPAEKVAGFVGFLEGKQRPSRLYPQAMELWAWLGKSEAERDFEAIGVRPWTEAVH